MSTLEQLRAQRPKEVGYARILAVVAAVLGLPVIGLLVPADVAGSSLRGLYGLAAALHVFAAFGVVKGRQNGRILSVITLAVLYFVMLPAIASGFSGSDAMFAEENAAIGVLAAVVGAAGVALQFRPAVNAYVNAVTAALREDSAQR